MAWLKRVLNVSYNFGGQLLQAIHNRCIYFIASIVLEDWTLQLNP